MKYKVGDRVRIKSLDWYNENINEIDEILCGITVFIPDMVQYISDIVTISAVFPNLGIYRIKEDSGMYNWTDEMIEGLVEEEIEKKLSNESWRYKNIFDNLQYPQSFECPEGYQFVNENGNVINARKIVLEKKKKEYPKTYEECCKVLGIDSTINHTIGTHFRYRDTIKHFINLLICRDAYWKLYGEEMGLGEPWEPDWCDYTTKYCILYSSQYKEFLKRQYDGIKHILAFPTEEIRDEFYENFKVEIEFCKELL